MKVSIIALLVGIFLLFNIVTVGGDKVTCIEPPDEIVPISLEPVPTGDPLTEYEVTVPPIEKEAMVEENIPVVEDIPVEEAPIEEVPSVEEDTSTSNFEEEYDFLAKLLYCEAGIMGWEGQVYTCSAILNLRDYSGRSIWEMGHDLNTFAVAPWVDYAEPQDMQYEVIDYVLNGGRVPDICFFRTDYYHDFGTPVCQIENVFFSMP